jgi:amidohydrolase
MAERRERLLAAAEAAAPAAEQLALRLYDHPEIGLEERQAAEWVGAALEEAGFTVARGVADLPTAFVASWGEAEARPVVAILAEYDALPELGHACGHNLIAGAAVLAGKALIDTLSPSEAQVRVIGCPAEETYGGKAQLVDRGLFADVDLALMAHGYFLHVGARPSSGRKSVVIEFHGKSAHAAAAPEVAVNALDAMILTFNGIGLMRQQLRDDARVHGIITHGGDAANIIPSYTRAECYVRAFAVDYLDDVEERLKACARGAAEATGCRVEFSAVTLPMMPLKHNATLETRYEDHVRALGETVGPQEPATGAGSTDFGNVSQVVPGAHSYFKVSDQRVASHTTEFSAVANQRSALDGMIVAAKAMALTALDAVDDPEFLARARREFAEGAGT